MKKTILLSSLILTINSLFSQIQESKIVVFNDVMGNSLNDTLYSSALKCVNKVVSGEITGYLLTDNSYQLYDVDNDYDKVMTGEEQTAMGFVYNTDKMNLKSVAWVDIYEWNIGYNLSVTFDEYKKHCLAKDAIVMEDETKFLTGGLVNTGGEYLLDTKFTKSIIQFLIDKQIKIYDFETKKQVSSEFLNTYLENPYNLYFGLDRQIKKGKLITNKILVTEKFEDNSSKNFYIDYDETFKLGFDTKLINVLSLIYQEKLPFQDVTKISIDSLFNTIVLSPVSEDKLLASSLRKITSTEKVEEKAFNNQSILKGFTNGFVSFVVESALNGKLKGYDVSSVDLLSVEELRLRTKKFIPLGQTENGESFNFAIVNEFSIRYESIYNNKGEMSKFIPTDIMIYLPSNHPENIKGIEYDMFSVKWSELKTLIKDKKIIQEIESGNLRSYLEKSFFVN